MGKGTNWDRAAVRQPSFVSRRSLQKSSKGAGPWQPHEDALLLSVETLEGSVKGQLAVELDRPPSVIESRHRYVHSQAYRDRLKQKAAE